MRAMYIEVYHRKSGEGKKKHGAKKGKHIALYSNKRRMSSEVMVIFCFYKHGKKSKVFLWTE